MSTDKHSSAAPALGVAVGSRLFPIMAEYARKERKDYPRATIPWDLIAPHERQADENHDQSLATLARRGGLSREEACAIIEDRAWMPMGESAADKRLAELVAAYHANNEITNAPPSGGINP
jgi:hypothetical protein